MFSSLWSSVNRPRVDGFLFTLGLGHFMATFDHPIVRLMSSGKAIVWVRVKTGQVVVVK